MATKCTEALFREWNAQQISYCSFKSNEHLEDGLDGKTDLDILIAEEDYNAAKTILCKNSFLQVEPVDVGAYPNVVNWYGMDYETGVLIHIHLHFELMTGKPLYKDYCLPWKGIFLRDAFCDTEFCVKRAEIHEEYVLLCTRIMIKRLVKPVNNSLPKDLVVELDYLKKGIDKETLGRVVAEMYGVDNTDYICNCMLHIQSLSNDEFIQFYKHVKKAMINNQRDSEFIALLISYMNRTKRRTSRIINRRFDTTLPLKKRFVNGGLAVAFVGIDGSGKSTVLSVIKEWLNAEFDIKVFYAGSGDGKKTIISSIALSAYGKYTNFKSARNTDKQKDGSNGLRSRKGLKYLMKGIGSAIAYLSILKSNISHLQEAQILSTQGVITLMDRYPQNSLPFVHDGAKVKKYDTGSGILHYFADEEQELLNQIKDYPFDIVFRLVVDPVVSYKRKPLEGLTSLEYKAATLQKVKLDAKKVININANQPLEKVVLTIKREIWNALVSNVMVCRAVENQH